MSLRRVYETRRFPAVPDPRPRWGVVEYDVANQSVRFGWMAVNSKMPPGTRSGRHQLSFPARMGPSEQIALSL
jgi:hypothetical protein